MKKLIIIYFLALLNLNYGQCRVNFVNIGGDYILEIVESGEDFEVISHNGIGADFTARIATGALQKADFQVKIVNYSSINSKCGFNLKNGRNSGSYANPGRGLVELNEKLTNEQIDGMRKLSEKMDRNVEQIKQNLNSNNTYNNSSYSNAESASKNSKAYFKRAGDKLNLNDYYGAIADYTKAIELSPNYADAYHDRGYSKQELGDYYGSISDFLKSIELGDYNALTYLNMANSKLNLKDYKGAIADYTKAIELKPDYALAFSNRGVSKQWLEDYYSSISDFNKAIKLEPDYADAYYNRGLSKYHLDQDYCSDFKKSCELGCQMGCDDFPKVCK